MRLVLLNDMERVIKMLKKYADKWIKALESGKYKKGKGFLCSIEGKNKTPKYCCLGVLCEILKVPKRNHQNIIDTEDGLFQTVEYGDNIGKSNTSLPTGIMKKVGIKESEGRIRNFNFDGSILLTTLNDSRDYSFKKIAKVIKKHYEEL